MAPRSSTSSSRGGRNFLAIWISVALVVLVEVCLNLALPESRMVRALHTLRAWVLEEPAPDIETLGDSVAYSALWSRELAAEAPPGVTVANHALPGSGPVFSYFLLRSEIEAGRVPGAILYAHSPHTFSGVRYPVLVGSFCTWREIAELAMTGREPTKLLYGVLCRLSYTLRYRDVFYDALHGDFSFFRDLEAIQPEQERLVSLETRWREAPPPGAGTIEVPDWFKGGFEISPLNRLYLDRFLDLAATHDIPVYWVTPPALPALHALREENGFNRDYLALVDSLAASGKVIPLHPGFDVYPESDFADHTHLQLPASLRFSRVIARELFGGTEGDDAD